MERRRIEPAGLGVGSTLLNRECTEVLLIEPSRVRCGGGYLGSLLPLSSFRAGYTVGPLVVEEGDKAKRSIRAHTHTHTHTYVPTK